MQASELVVRFAVAGQRALRNLLRVRRYAGLTQPYGPQAAALGLGDPDPPSRRDAAGP